MTQDANNIFYAHSGGVTSVINASASGVIQAARTNQSKIGSVFIGKNGILGALHENLIDAGQMDEASVEALKQTPASAFGSCRYKLKSLDENRREYERLIEVFKAHEIGYFFYNGGNDSQDTAHKVWQMSLKMDHPLVCIGIPKTIDNDLPLTDCCPGFGSVAKYVATSILEASFDVASMAASSTKVFILEVMGRHAGWITAAGGLAAGDPIIGPHILLLPEVTFDETAFLKKVQETVDRYGHCSIVASEGIQNAAGEFIAAGTRKDAFGHSQLGGVAPILAALVQDKLCLKQHWAVSDYLQRSARHIASATDLEQAYALGSSAVDAAIRGENGVMMTIERLQDSPYQWEVGTAKLEDVANVEHCLPPEFISEDGFGITDACRAKLLPLIQGEAALPYKNGLPDYRRFELTCLPKKLPAFD